MSSPGRGPPESATRPARAGRWWPGHGPDPRDDGGAAGGPGSGFCEQSDGGPFPIGRRNLKAIKSGGIANSLLGRDPHIPPQHAWFPSPQAAAGILCRESRDSESESRPRRFEFDSDSDTPPDWIPATRTRLGIVRPPPCAAGR